MLWTKFKWWLRSKFNSTYVVIFDYGEDGFELEEYYGYFSSQEEAIRMYKQLVGNDEGYSNARLCRVVRLIP